MAKPNYSGEKRRKELEKQRKKEEKKRRKLEHASASPTDGNAAETPDATDEQTIDVSPPLQHSGNRPGHNAQRRRLDGLRFLP